MQVTNYCKVPDKVFHILKEIQDLHFKAQSL